MPSSRIQRVTQRLALLGGLFLTGIGVRSLRAQLNEKNTVYAGTTRTWYEHVPASYDGSRPVPLVLALHGINGSGDQFAPASEWMTVADSAGFIVVFPTGGLTVGTNFGWNAFVYDGKAPDDAGFLLALIQGLQKTYRIDATRIYMTGFSNGGGMASTFAELHASILAGIAPVSGGWRASFGMADPVVTPDAPIPVWIRRGASENFQNGSLTLAGQDHHQTHFWADFDGDKSPPQVYRQPPYTTTIYRGGQAEVRYTLIDGADHAYQPGTAEKLWYGFFCLFSRQGTAIVYHPLKSGR